MHSTIYSAALVGAALVSAAPAPKPQGWSYPMKGADMGQYKDQYKQDGSGNDGTFDFLDALNDNKLLLDIENQAHGTLPNGPPPPPLNPDTFISLDLIATNELAEVKFFQEFLDNVTKAGDGFGDDQFKDGLSRDFLIDTLKVIVGVEELHALNAEGALIANNQPPIQPSQYQFPVNNLQDAFAFANILTDNVLGVLQDVARRAADAGDSELINGFASVIGEEGEQNGFFRVNQIIDGKQTRNPSGEPFLTGSARDLAFSALEQNVIVPGTDKNKIDLTVFEKLILLTPQDKILPVNQDLAFQIVLDAPVGNDAQGVDGGKDRSGSSSSGSGSSASWSSSSAGPTSSTATIASHAKRALAARQGSAAPTGSPSSSSSSYSSSSSGSSSGSSSSDSSSSGKSGLDLSQYGANYDWQNKGSQEFFVTYITEQNLPISEPLKNVQFNKDNFTLSFTALFPAGDNIIHGFAIGTVTKGSNFTNPEDVANNTFAGPASIELID